jgi:hypothetical protein
MTGQGAGRLEGIRERLGKASKGPWRVATSQEDAREWWGRGDKEGVVILHAEDPKQTEFPIASTNDDGLVTEQNIADADFIAHAPEDLAYLLSALQAAEALAEVLENFRAIDNWLPHDVDAALAVFRALVPPAPTTERKG